MEKWAIFSLSLSLWNLIVDRAIAYVPEWQLARLTRLFRLRKLVRKVSYFMLIHMLPNTFHNTLAMFTCSRGHIVVFLLCTKLNSASVMCQPNYDIHAKFFLKPSITEAITWMFNWCSESIACFTRTDSVSALSPAVKWKLIGSFHFFFIPTAISTRAFVTTFSVYSSLLAA